MKILGYSLDTRYLTRTLTTFSRLFPLLHHGKKHYDTIKQKPSAVFAELPTLDLGLEKDVL